MHYTVASKPLARTTIQRIACVAALCKQANHRTEVSRPRPPQKQPDVAQPCQTGLRRENYAYDWVFIDAAGFVHTILQFGELKLPAKPSTTGRIHRRKQIEPGGKGFRGQRNVRTFRRFGSPKSSVGEMFYFPKRAWEACTPTCTYHVVHADYCG